MLDVEQMIDELIVREGGYVNHPADRGGPTKYGITQRRLAEYRRKAVTIQDVKDLSKVEAASIYRGSYLIESGLYRIQDPYVLTLAFDCGVNHGPRRAVQWLQKIVGVIDDGIFGDRTEVAVNSYDPLRLYRRLLMRRFEFYGEIITYDPKLRAAKHLGLRLQAENALGWLRRAAGFIEVT